MRYYTVNQVAERFGIHRRTILRQIQAGRLKAIQIGRQWRIPESTIRACWNISRDKPLEMEPAGGQGP